MGRGKAEQPKRLAEKLKQIRLDSDMSQEEMVKVLERQGVKVYRSYVSAYEKGERAPTLLITFAYATLANVSMETLVNDKLDLPKSIKKT